MKLLKFLIVCFSVFLVATPGKSQNYVSSGKIVYERKMNLWSDLSDSRFEGFKKMIPEYKIDKFELTFTPEKSLYKPTGEMQKILLPLPASENVVYTEFDIGKQVALKAIYDKTYLFEDELRRATWKIKDDFREIAGFSCRRATTILFDSVFVVAFYTDAIIPSAGPESFSGLPGAILGLVINRLHTTWYATSVEPARIDEKSILPPAKGTKTTMKELRGNLDNLIKNFGAMGDKLLWMVEI